MKPSEDRHRPRKRFGQHFLANVRVADKIVASANLGDTDTVLEIGPGRGVLTERLIGASREVYAVEIDRDLTAPLTARFGGEPGFHLVSGDILKLDLGAMFAGERSRITVVSNLPYNISSPVIEHLARYRNVIGKAVLMLQKEVAARLLAHSGSKDYGLLTLNFSLYAEGKKIMDVRPGSFIPPPSVMSTVLSVKYSEDCRYPLHDTAVFRAMTGSVFRQRRKMIRNTLAPFAASLGIGADVMQSMLEAAGIKPEARPESIAVERFVELSNRFSSVSPLSPAAEDTL